MAEVININFLCRLEIKGINHVIHWCMINNLIEKDYMCPKCGCFMKLSESMECVDGFERYCAVKDNENPHFIKVPIRKGSWFEESNLSMNDSLLLTYLWTVGFSDSSIVRELPIVSSNQIINHWKLLCREICMEVCINKNSVIGGHGIVVDFFDTKYDTRKFFEEKDHDKKWIFVGIERPSNKFFFKVVEGGTKQNLLNVIKEFILPGSIIISDRFKSASFFLDDDLINLKMNLTYQSCQIGTRYRWDIPQEEICSIHQENEFDSDFANLLEMGMKETWCTKQGKLYNIHKEHFSLCLAEHVWKKQNPDGFKIFKSFIKAMTEVHKAQNSLLK